MSVLEKSKSCINRGNLYNEFKGEEGEEVEEVVDSFKLVIDNEEMTVHLVSSLPVPDTHKTVDSVKTALSENNVFKGIDFGAIDNAFKALPEIEDEGVEFPIAKGKAPIAGKNGTLTFEVNVSGKPIYDTSAVENADSVDFKNAVRIESVTEGQVIARIEHPTKGVPGFSLAGKEIPARDGKEAVYRLGEGVEISPDGCTVRSTQEGKPVFAHKIISVSPIYEVHGDVCYETGNIKFNGYVHVYGGVLDDFSIEAKNIEVDGVIGAATLICSNNVILHGGINGKNKAEVKCNGSAEIKYVNAARIEAKGNVNIAREAVNSTIWSRGKITAEKIIGGEAVALLGVEAKYLGSEMGVQTVVEPGGNYEVRRIEQAMDVLGMQLNKILNPLKGIMGDHKKFLALPAEKQEELRKSYDYFARIRAAHDKLTTARRKLLSDQSLQPKKFVILLKTIFPDVVIRTDKCVRQFRENASGPTAFLEDVATGGIRQARYNLAKGKIIDPLEEKNKEEGGANDG